MKEPIEPRKPYKPLEPQEYMEDNIDVSLSYDKKYSIKDIAALLPPNITIDDLTFCDRENYNHDCCCSSTKMFISYLIKIKTPGYTSAMKRYFSYMKKYETEMENYADLYKKYKEEKKLYDDWSEEEELKNLKKRLKKLEQKRNNNGS